MVMNNETKLMVTIPCEEYAALIRKSAMLDILLSRSDEAASYQLVELAEVIKGSLAGGDKANA